MLGQVFFGPCFATARLLIFCLRQLVSCFLFRLLWRLLGIVASSSAFGAALGRGALPRLKFLDLSNSHQDGCMTLGASNPSPTVRGADQSIAERGGSRARAALRLMRPRP